MSEEEKDKDKKNISNVFKKIFTTGMTAAFLTEDALKNVLADLPVPKELAQGLLQNAKASKEEFINSVKKELKGFLDKIDIQKELDKVIEKYDIEVTAKINLKRKKNKEK